MKRIGWTMMLLGAALWIAGCSGKEQKPPAGPPAVDTEALTPDDQPAETQPDQTQPEDAQAAVPADEPAAAGPDEAPLLTPPKKPDDNPPNDPPAAQPEAKTGAAEKEKGKVAKAVGKALWTAVAGKSEKEERSEAPAFKP